MSNKRAHRLFVLSILILVLLALMGTTHQQSDNNEEAVL